MEEFIDKIYNLRTRITIAQNLTTISINSEVAALLRQLARYSDNIWKSTSYTKAAKIIEDLVVPVTEIEDLRELEGVGRDISEEIQEYLETGTIKKLEVLKKEEEKGGKRLPVKEVLERTRKFFDKAQAKNLEYEVVGSIRRGEDMVKDIDIIVYEEDMEEWTALAEEYDDFKARGKKYIDFLMNGIEINIWSVDPTQFGAMVLYRTGPKSFNVYLAQRAKEKGYVITPTGLFDEEGNRIAIDEKEIFKKLDEAWIEPTKR